MKLKLKLVIGYFCAILYADPRILYSSDATTGFNKTPGQLTGRGHSAKPRLSHIKGQENQKASVRKAREG